MVMKRNQYFTRDELLPFVEQKMSIPQIAKELNSTLFKVKMSLVYTDLFTGKKYHFICENCGKEFFHATKGYKFCSNECKHLRQHIWNRNKTKYNNDILARQAEGKLGNTHSLYAEKTEIFHLDSINLDVEYNPRSMEKDFLKTLNNKKGLIHIEKIKEPVEFEDDYGIIRRHMPDYALVWESGVVWIVEIKGVITVKDVLKANAARKMANEHGFQYRLYTKGFIKYDIWNRFHADLASFKTPSKEFVMMNNAVVWSTLSCSHSLKVGCVISDMFRNEILAVGYNGDEAGVGSNVAECLQPGESGWIHAEENALLKLSSDKDCVMFLTDSPCEMCAKKIINSGKIKEVYYLREYRDLTGVGRLIDAGISTYKFVLLGSSGEHLSDSKAFDIIKPGGLDMLINNKRPNSAISDLPNCAAEFDDYSV